MISKAGRPTDLTPGRPPFNPSDLPGFLQRLAPSRLPTMRSRFDITPARLGRRGINQQVRGYSECGTQPPNHVDGQLSLTCQNFRNSGTGSYDWLQISTGQTLLVHAKLNGRNRVRSIHGVVLRFV